MRPRTCLNALTPLLESPTFTAREAKAVGVSSAGLCHYVKVGILTRVRRGVYQRAGQGFSSMRWEDLALAVHAIPGSVVCLLSALAIYDLTEEIPRQHWVGIRHGASARGSKQLKIVRFRDLELGKTEIHVDGICLPILDQERTLIDSFRLLGRETALKALKIALSKRGKDRIDLVRLEDYSQRLRFDISPYLQSALLS